MSEDQTASPEATGGQGTAGQPQTESTPIEEGGTTGQPGEAEGAEAETKAESSPDGIAPQPLLEIGGRKLYTQEEVIEFTKEVYGQNGNLAGELSKLRGKNTPHDATEPSAEGDEVDAYFRERGYVKESKVKEIVDEQVKQAIIDLNRPQHLKQLRDLEAKYPDWKEHAKTVQLLIEKTPPDVVAKMLGKESFAQLTLEDIYLGVKRASQRNLASPNKPSDPDAVGKPIASASGTSSAQEPQDAHEILAAKFRAMHGL